VGWIETFRRRVKGGSGQTNCNSIDGRIVGGGGSALLWSECVTTPWILCGG